MTYNYVEAEYFVEASAIKNSIGGICGFVSSILAGKLLEYVQSNGNSIFGIHIYGQQLLALISTLIIFSAILFTHFVVKKQKRTVQ